MASFRRTLSPAVHDRAAQNGDIFLDSSPIHKFPSPSSYSSPVASSCASVFSLISFMPVSVVVSYIQTFLLAVCPLKSSRPVERSKTKVQVWKRALLHFLLCFIVGLLTGFTPFSMANFSTNLDSKYQEFALELKTGATNAQQDFSQIGNRERMIETVKMDMENKKSSEIEAQHEQEAEMLAVPSENADPFAGLSSVRVFDFVPRKLLIVVTPTYNRAFQAFYLNRLAHTLRLVPPPLLWIVVEMPAQSMETAAMLRRTGVMYRHLVCEKNATNIKDRGVHQRNAALAHIEQHQLDGIVYFADDDNVYTLELFEQLREIRRFGTWPVGMLADSKNKAILEGPVCNGSQVIGWHTNEKSKRLRRFHVDMSGFAFNSTILWDPRRWGRLSLQPIRQLDTVKEGFQETTFIEQVVEDESQMEGLPSNCSKIMVWHLHLEAPGLAYPRGWTLENNLDVIVPLKKR